LKDERENSEGERASAEGGSGLAPAQFDLTSRPHLFHR
jgi:hypothetical protein